jgi:hypothetical protein
MAGVKGIRIQHQRSTALHLVSPAALQATLLGKGFASMPDCDARHAVDPAPHDAIRVDHLDQ